MPRPRINTHLLYADVIHILDLALQNNGGRYRCESSSWATSKMHRCNIARKRIREDSEDGICLYDQFVIKTEGEWLRIEPRNKVDPALFERLDGAPVVSTERDYELEAEGLRLIREMQKNGPPPPLNLNED